MSCPQCGRDVDKAINADLCPRCFYLQERTDMDARMGTLTIEISNIMDQKCAARDRWLWADAQLLNVLDEAHELPWAERARERRA